MPDQDQKSSPFNQRQARLSHALANSPYHALALNPGPSLIYLTGLHFHLSERPTVAIFRPESEVILILPELEMRKTEGLDFAIRAFAYGENPATWPDTFQKAIQAANLETASIGVEPGRLRFLELRLMEAVAPEASFVSAEDVLNLLRLSKDESEIAAMRQAVHIAQQALLKILPRIKIGVTERQVASMLTMELLQQGSESEMPFAPIVSSGPNSANPHATPSDRVLQAGDLLVIDWGATYQGYLSDLTRTFAVGEVEQEFQDIHAIVQEANAAGRKACQPGIPASVVDQSARDVIEKAGYGAYFTHRTGHGLGLEGHEPPYIRADNPLVLQPGMTFTVEPGIYLPGRGGVRIEDDMVITADGAESLSDLPRQLMVIG